MRNSANDIVDYLADDINAHRNYLIRNADDADAADCSPRKRQRSPC